MKLTHKLSDHPFYVAWNKGEITRDQLSNYAKSYENFIERIPEYWQKVITGFDVKDTMSGKVVNEEIEHIELWKRWSDKLEDPVKTSLMSDIIYEFDNMSVSELLGALHAFEIQQPEVSRTKKEGLLKYYGFNENDTKYFDEHLKELKHIEYGELLYKSFADKHAFEKGYNKGSEMIYKSLDRFMN